MKSIFPALALVFAASLTPAQEGRIIGAHSLALSPDGQRLAFSYLGDIWIAPAAGGEARLVTSHVEMDDYPVWSPDGKRIAFASNRYGNPDIFVVDADGGRPKRVTYASTADIPSDWTNDGKEILLRTTRDASENGIYAISPETGKFRLIFRDMMSVGSPKISPDGDKILYTRFGFPATRPRYSGSAAAQLWTYDLKTAKRTEVRNDGFQHLWPAWNGSGIWAVTVTKASPSTAPVGQTVGKIKFDVAQTPNVYKMNLAGKADRKTEWAGDVIDSSRFLTVARSANAYAFERGGQIYVSQDGSMAKQITLTANADDRTTQEERQIVTTGAESFDLSPDGANVVFTARNDLWRVPVKKGEGPNKDDAEQLTIWAGSDGEPLFTPDGKAVFFVSDRDGAERLYRMDVTTKVAKALTTEDSDISNLALTPDKRSISFWRTGKEGGLYSAPVDGGPAKRLFAFTGSEGRDYAFSPDGRYVAYARELGESGYYYWEAATNIYVLDVATGESKDVTQLAAQHSVPTWSPDGKTLYFFSDRSGDGLYALSLQPEEVRGAEQTIKYVKPAKDAPPVKVEIDFDGIERRVRKLSSTFGRAIVADPEDGSLYLSTSGNITRLNANGEEPRQITTAGDVRGLKMAADGKSLLYVQNGLPTILNLRAQNYPQTPVTFRAEWTRDMRAERRAAFAQFWREFNRGFYDPNFHGRDWSALRAKYEPLLDSVGHQQEFAAILGSMVGELESSHSEVSAYNTAPRSVNTAHLGFLFDYAYSGSGIKILEVPARTPGAYAKSKLSPGEVVTKINGKDASLNEAFLADALGNQAGREITLTVQGTDGKSREVKYRALSAGEFGGIVFGNRLEARRKYVEQKSGGKVTYVQIAGMSQGELDVFNQQVWQYARGKSGLIIDVRNNGGGNTSDRIIDVLERRQNSIYQLRDEDPIRGPGQALGVPMVVMMAETSYSNAEMFPSAMKARGLAKLVGKPTPGYVIYTGGLTLVDGTGARMPGTGSYRLDGTPMENMGQKPDYDVDITPEDYFAGRDPQLDKAIEVLLKEIK